MFAVLLAGDQSNSVGCGGDEMSVSTNSTDSHLQKLGNGIDQVLPVCVRAYGSFDPALQNKAAKKTVLFHTSRTRVSVASHVRPTNELPHTKEINA